MGHFYSWDDGVSTDPLWAKRRLEQPTVICDGVECHRVLFCVEGENGLVKSLATDEKGLAISSHGGVLMTRFIMGNVEVRWNDG